MARLTQRTHMVAVLLAALFTAGCDSATPTQSASADPSTSPLSVYTHCGIESIRIDGRWWHAEPPLYSQKRSGPPAGWSDPYQEGTLTMESAERAVFEALGERVVFVPAPDNEPLRVCR